METPQFRLIVVGDENVGKTSMITRYVSGMYLQEHTPTVDTNKVDITFTTNYGKITAECYDMAGDSDTNNNVNNTAYYMFAQAAIIMFDKTNLSSFHNVEKWYKTLSSHSRTKIPIVLVGNKCEAKDIAVSNDEIRKMIKKYDVKYCDLSVRACLNFEKPFLYALKGVTGRDNLSIGFDDDEVIDEITRVKEEDK
jgi:small GTP-binding protein